jgi:hypothetical protein
MISFGTCNSSFSEYIHVPSSTTAYESSFVNNVLANVVVCFWQNSSYVQNLNVLEQTL